MIAVDTNIIIRLLTRDEESQYQVAFDLFQQQQIFIPKTVILEAEWVLRYAYDFDAGQVVEALKRLLGLANVEVEDPEAVASAVEWHSHGLDFADALHLAASQHADRFATFDHRLVQRAGSLSTIEVVEGG